MLFNSFTYVVFFIVVAIVHYLVPHKFRWMLLLVASYIFYMAWRPELILLILFSTLVNFYLAQSIFFSGVDANRRLLLVISLIINFGLLFTFKYLVFMNNTLCYLFTDYPVREFDIILPIGISFYTFQAAAYTIDVYKGIVKPQSNFFKFSLFITFFPQLVAGPIERSKKLMPQLFEQKKLSLENICAGCKWITIGFFKKIVIADRLSILVNKVYNSPENFSGPAFVVATVFFAFQIYCDFSGYSDIAIGCAKVFGINLSENFRQPYISRNVKEFWRRWHITLSSWFRDYLYIPLGGSRGSKLKRHLNLFITFLVSGLWHGANWTFVIWGGLNGLLQIIEDITGLRKIKLLRFFRLDVALTFSVICFTWIFFRANNLSESVYIVTNLCTGWDINLQQAFNLLNSMGLSLFELFICFGLLMFLWLTDLIAGDGSLYAKMEQFPFVIRFPFYFLLVAAILSLGVFYNAGQFIYFQF